MSRCIDADALEKEGWSLHRTIRVDKNTEEYQTKPLRQVPTIEPQRKKGKWVGYDGDWLKTMCKCSECGAMIDINEKYRNFFCYHCGARMDGEIEAWNRRGMNG